MGSKSYAVLGLGTFGMEMAKALASMGSFVLACDSDARKIDEIKDNVSDVAIADVADEDVIRELNVAKFDAVILNMSSHFEKQVLALTLLKQEGAKQIIAKSTSKIQERILLKLGADVVISPEQATAKNMAQKMICNVNEMMEFRGASIAEGRAPSAVCGKTLRSLSVRSRCNVTILLCSAGGTGDRVPVTADTVLCEDDVITVFGPREAVLDFFR